MADIDFPLSLLDASSFNLGLWGYYEVLPERLQAEWFVRHSWLPLGRLTEKGLPHTAEANIGENFFLVSRTLNKNLKVTLKVTEEYKYSEGVAYTYEKYIMAPGTVQQYMGLRGGLYYRRNLYILDDSDTGLPYELSGTMQSVGLYGGVIVSRTQNLFVKVKNYGLRYNSIGSSMYADLLIVPVNTFTNIPLGTSDKDVAKQALPDFPIGIRLGYKLYQVAPRSKTGKRFGLSAAFEAGYKPYLGLFAYGGLGMTLIK